MNFPDIPYELNEAIDRSKGYFDPIILPCESCSRWIYFQQRIYLSNWKKLCKECAYGELWIKFGYAHVNLEANIECPYCEHYYDLLDVEESGDLFWNEGDFNSWTNFEYETTCPECNKEFMVDEVSF